MLTNHVFVLNADKTFLNMAHPARARKLLSQNKAAVFRTFPFVIILKNQISNPVIKEYILKIDPGSIGSGFAIQDGDKIIFRMELQHRGAKIKSDLQTRAKFRCNRRYRNLRYRKKRFERKVQPNWLPPSLRHRVVTTETWIKRFSKYCHIICIEIEQVRFDTQKIINPEISGILYQQGSLYGYEIREYLLEKFDRKCAYCGVENTILETEHIIAKSRGGSDRVSNLTIACHECNQQKSDKDLSNFLSEKYKLDLIKAKQIENKILQQSQQPLKDAAAVNATRFAIVDMAKKYSKKVNTWTGGRTKMNRCQQELPKSHSIDAACVGESGANIKILTFQPLLVTCKGHGNRQSIRINDKGFPTLITKKCKKTGKQVVQKNPDGSVKIVSPKTVYKHISVGDIVKFELIKPAMTKGNKKKGIKKAVKVEAGCYTERVRTPTPKGFEVMIKKERITVPSMTGVKFIHRNDGYDYSFST